MAERRMFAKAVIESGPFLEMSPAAQALYLHLGMLADDDGFVGNPRQVMRMMGASKKAWEQLMKNQLLLTFPSGACVIRHWFVHNYIRADRYRDTIYQDEKAQLYLEGNKAYTLTPPPDTEPGRPDGDPLADLRSTQDRLNQTKGNQKKEKEHTPGQASAMQTRVGQGRIGQERAGQASGAADEPFEEPEDIFSLPVSKKRIYF